MALAVVGVLYFLPQRGGSGGNFTGFLAMFMVLFVTTGIGNGSTFRMIPVIFLHRAPARRRRARRQAAREQAIKDGNKEAAAVLGFSRRDRRLRRLLHPEELRHLDRADRRPRGGAVLLHRLLPDLHRDDLVVLRAQGARCPAEPDADAQSTWRDAPHHPSPWRLAP